MKRARESQLDRRETIKIGGASLLTIAGATASFGSVAADSHETVETLSPTFVGEDEAILRGEIPLNSAEDVDGSLYFEYRQVGEDGDEIPDDDDWVSAEPGEYEIHVDGLEAGEAYEYRSVWWETLGTSYRGDWVQFSTGAAIEGVETHAVDRINGAEVDFAGGVDFGPNGNWDDTRVFFEYRPEDPDNWQEEQWETRHVMNEPDDPSAFTHRVGGVNHPGSLEPNRIYEYRLTVSPRAIDTEYTGETKLFETGEQLQGIETEVVDTGETEATIEVHLDLDEPEKLDGSISNYIEYSDRTNAQWSEERAFSQPDNPVVEVTLSDLEAGTGHDYRPSAELPNGEYREGPDGYFETEDDEDDSGWSIPGFTLPAVVASLGGAALYNRFRGKSDG